MHKNLVLQRHCYTVDFDCMCVGNFHARWKETVVTRFVFLLIRNRNPARFGGAVIAIQSAVNPTDHVRALDADAIWHSVGGATFVAHRAQTIPGFDHRQDEG